MINESGEPVRSTASDGPTPAVRLRRRVARVVALAALLVIIVVGLRFGFVDFDDHHGLVTTLWVAAAVFVLAFPFLGFIDASPGNRRGDEDHDGPQ